MTSTEFEHTVFIFKNDMYRFAFKILGSSEEAKDIVQELLLTLWKKKNELHEYSNLKSFILKSTKNACLNKIKHKSVVNNFCNQHQSDECKTYDYNNLKEYIIQFINELPVKQKMVMHLKDVEEYDTKEISDILNIDENAVRVNLHRGRNKVKEQIEQLREDERRVFRLI